MNYIDFAIALSLFLFFFAAVIMFSTNYFSNLSGLTKTSEFRPVSETLFKLFFERKGIPENWNENYSVTPVKVGLMEDLYMIPIVVRETNGSVRTNEPVTTRITFDENCQNRSWNTTVRLYDEDDNELNIEMSNTTFCTSQYLNVSNITWDVNISANQVKNYYLYYSPDDGVTDPGYTSLAYNTSSWIPSDRDEWTDTTKYWREYSTLSTANITNDTTNKIRGISSVNITGSYPGASFGLDYAPPSRIPGVTNDWYIDTWFYVDDISGLSAIYIVVFAGTGPTLGHVIDNISANMTSSTWYHFVKQLDPNLWEFEVSFDASNEIGPIQFYIQSGYQIRTLKIDGLHFKKKPLIVKTFPEEQINTFSSNKFDALKNMTYDESRKLIGENYKFRIEIYGESYGGDMSKSANVGCYESPRVVENSNGTISKVMAKMCVWK